MSQTLVEGAWNSNTDDKFAIVNEVVREIVASIGVKLDEAKSPDEYMEIVVEALSIPWLSDLGEELLVRRTFQNE